MALVAGVLCAGTVALTGSPAVAAPNRTVEGGPSLGVSFIPEEFNSQCEGPQEQWTDGPNWTVPVRIDADNRPGGCRLAFGVDDPDYDLAGVRLEYEWLPTPGGDAAQCGTVVGRKRIPVTPFGQLSTELRIDTDHRTGYCELTFHVSRRADVVLDVQFTGEHNWDQCKGATPVGQPRTATTSQPVTIGIDTDGRAGGCFLSLRVRQV